MRAIRINGKIEQRLPRSLNGIENLNAYSTEELKKKKLEVYDIIEPPLTDGQRYGALVYDEAKDTVSRSVEAIPVPTTQEITDAYNDARERLSEVEYRVGSAFYVKEQKLKESATQAQLDTLYALRAGMMAQVEETETTLKDYMDNNNLDSLVNYSPDQAKVKEFINQIESV